MKSFSELNLSEPLQQALTQLKFETPTPIQEQVMPLAMRGADVIACAETGSGKTGGYGIPIVEKLLAEQDKHALILAPTRELVHQIADFMRNLIGYTRGIGVTALVGGADMRKQIMALKKQPRIIVATPGRLIDHLKRRTLRLNKAEMLVLDEGDRMLDMGFAPQLDEILKYLPTQRQTSLFTATLPPKVRKLADSYLSNPVKVQIGEGSLPVATIKQSVVPVAHRDKDKVILDELNKRTGSIIIFTRTKQRTDMLADYLDQYGFEVDLIHGGRSQGQRNRAIDNFRKGRVRILCATDVAARGIDIPKVEHVINFDLPMMDEDYVHRIGRTGRNGASGEAVSFVAPDEIRSWRMLVKKFKIEGADLGRSDDSSERGGGGGRRGGSRRPYGGGGNSSHSRGSGRAPYGGGQQRESSSDYSAGPKKSGFGRPQREESQEYSSSPKKSYGNSRRDESSEYGSSSGPRKSGFKPGGRSGAGFKSRSPEGGESGPRKERSFGGGGGGSQAPRKRSPQGGSRPSRGEGKSFSFSR